MAADSARLAMRMEEQEAGGALRAGGAITLFMCAKLEPWHAQEDGHRTGGCVVESQSKGC